MRERSVSQNYARMRVVVIVLIGVHLAYAEMHSLQYFCTATSGLHQHHYPEFVSVGVVDGQPFTYYDSKIRRMTPKQEWMAKSVGDDYWDQQTQVSVVAERAFMTNINLAKKRFNHTGGVHTFQRMYGCEWDDQTGAKNGFRQEGYDGADFVFLDLKELRWFSAVQQGFITAQKWNNDRYDLEYEKQYFSTECIEWLQKYVNYGKSSQRKTVSPQVSLLQNSSSSPVSCHATGFYPSGVTISWMKNGEELHEDVDLDELLPNEDGTFQKTSSIRVKPDEWKKNQFICVVEHQDKTFSSILTEKEIRTNSESTETSVPIGIIVGAVAAVIIILLVVVGVAGFKVNQKKKDFKPVSGSDESSSERSTSSQISSGSVSSTSS